MARKNKFLDGHEPHLADMLLWISTHTLISIHRLEIEAKTPVNTIARALGGRDKLPAKHYPNILKLLRAYGYTTA